MTVHSVNTPYYVLLDGKQRLSPKMLALHGDLQGDSQGELNGGPEYVAIFGFSDKQPYDLFCANSELALKPYPLVKGYLKNQITDSGDVVSLVVVDAAGPQEDHLNAATMNSVLDAHEQKANQVTISFRLTLDQESQAYRVEKDSSDLEQTSSPTKWQRT